MVSAFAGCKRLDSLHSTRNRSRQSSARAASHATYASCDGQVGEVVRRLAELDEPGFAHILVKLVRAVRHNRRLASSAALVLVLACSLRLCKNWEQHWAGLRLPCVSGLLWRALVTQEDRDAHDCCANPLLCRW